MKKTILIATLLAGVVMSAAAVQAQDASEPRERPAFSMLDADGDGNLTLAEMQAQRDARFGTADANGDGGLSAEELIAVASERQADRITRMLERFDANEDGLLQEAEMPQRGGDRAERMFERVDADGDGMITEAEFDAAKDRMGDRKGSRDRG